MHCKLDQGKLMMKLNERIMKWLTEKRAYTKIKPRKCGRYIGTKENDDTISPKMFLQKYGIAKEGIHCLSCNVTYTKDKISAAEEEIQKNKTTKCKKVKKKGRN